jgi:hypothetical protein
MGVGEDVSSEVIKQALCYPTDRYGASNKISYYAVAAQQIAVGDALTPGKMPSA